MKTSTERILLPIAFALLAAALVYFGWQTEKRHSEPAYQASVAESIEQADAARLIVRPREVYASYSLVRNFGVQKSTGATWVKTDAWNVLSNDPAADNARFIADLIRTLKEAGTIDDIDLNKRGNHLVVLWPGAPPRKAWVLDSRELPGEATE